MALFELLGSDELKPYTFVVKKVSKTEIELILSGEVDKVLINRVDSSVPSIKISDVGTLYDFVAQYMCDAGYNLVEQTYEGTDELYDIVDAMSKNTSHIVCDRADNVVAYLNKLEIDDYAVIILKEE